MSLPRGVVAAAVLVLVALSGCAVSRTTPPPSTAVSSGSSVDSAGPTTSTPPVPSENPTGAAPTSAAPASSVAVTSPAQATSASSSASSSATATPLDLPDRFGTWLKIEGRTEGAWTIAAYTNTTSGAVIEVRASSEPGVDVAKASEVLLGSGAHQVSTGATCASRTKFAGCTQLQDGVVYAVLSPGLSEQQVSEALGQLLAAVR